MEGEKESVREEKLAAGNGIKSATVRSSPVAGIIPQETLHLATFNAPPQNPILSPPPASLLKRFPVLLAFFTHTRRYSCAPA